MTHEEIKDIKKVLDSGTGMALKSYLFKCLEELKSIENVQEKDVGAHMAIEVKAQKRAYLKLKEILSAIMSLSEDAKQKDPRDSFFID
ncbi:MAG: hypothetical protein WC346_01375 [Methanogenium sp.]|jgi:hypothetical protein